MHGSWKMYLIILKACANKAIREDPAVFFLVPDRFKTQEMCIKALEVDSWLLNDVPDHFKMQDGCDRAVRDDFSYLQYVPDWFVTREGVYMWYDDCDYYHDDEDNFLSGTMVIKNERLKKPQ